MPGVIFQAIGSIEWVINMLIVAMAVAVESGLPYNLAERDNPGLVCTEKGHRDEQRIGQRKWFVCQVGMTIDQHGLFYKDAMSQLNTLGSPCSPIS